MVETLSSSPSVWQWRLLVGWVAFPRVLYMQKHQPLDFLHKTHAEKSGLADCNECHTVRDDGTFAGLPAMEKCAGCHSEKVGESKAEATLVDSYITPGHETPWLVYSTTAGECLVLARDPREARGVGVHRMPFDVWRVGPGANLPSEPHQRLQPRHLGAFDLTDAARAARGHEDERLRRLPFAAQR